MESEGQRTSSTPSAVLASLLCKRAKLHEELRNIEKQVYDMETSYLQDPSQCGNVLKGFEGFLSSSKNTTLQKNKLLDEMVGLYWLMDSKYFISSDAEGNQRRVGVALEMQRDRGNQANQILTMKTMLI
ncbi:uncharacterized protein [Coffea arabica]|uniref:Uncharacterized protein isoform X1 n=1 Tax=Coffea arabica TaxID=13443 RepID=A0ABM4X3P9_COFAR